MPTSDLPPLPPLPAGTLASLDQSDAAGRDLIDQIVLHIRAQLDRGMPPSVLALSLGEAIRAEGLQDMFADICGLALVRLATIPHQRTDPRKDPLS